MIDLCGDWVHHPTKGYRDWRGTIVAPYEWLAVALFRVNDTVSWIKSSAMVGREEHDVRLLVSPPEQRIGTSISYGIAGTAARYNLSTMEPEVFSSIPASCAVTPGKPFWLATASVSVDLGLGGIIIRRDDTERLRKGIWRPKEASSGLSSALREMLAVGRVGATPLATLAEGL
jgi:hypothetical protein